MSTGDHCYCIPTYHLQDCPKWVNTPDHPDPKASEGEHTIYCMTVGRECVCGRPASEKHPTVQAGDQSFCPECNNEFCPGDCKTTASEGWEVVLWWCEKCNQSIYVLRPEKVCTICSNPPSPLIRQSDAEGWKTAAHKWHKDYKALDRKLADSEVAIAKGMEDWKRISIHDGEMWIPRLDADRKLADKDKEINRLMRMLAESEARRR